MTRARVCLHIEKPKHQATIKKMSQRKSINYMMFTIQYTNDDGGRVVAMAMLPPPPTKPITLHWQHGFSRGGKKEEYAKPRT